MTTTVWIARNWTGHYNVFKSKPRMIKTGLWFGEPFMVLSGNQEEQKRILGLKRHIRKERCSIRNLTINLE